MNHKEHSLKSKPAKPCTCHDLNFGGECFNCGWKPEANISELIACPETECPNCHNGTIALENGRLVCRGECGNDFGKIVPTKEQL